jgi:hypothetical protein
MNDNAVNQLARIIRDTQQGSAIARENNNFAKPFYGKVVDVEDPEERGRVKIVPDWANPEIHTEDEGFEDSGQETISDWIEPAVPFKGVQPEAWKDLRVPVIPKNGDPNRLFFGTPVNDELETTTAAPPENSDMVRLSVYPSGELPPADEQNVGCVVLEQGGPMDSDWLCVCMKRKGEYYWVRHVDLAHGHAGEDDGDQDPDTDGDGEVPVKENAVWDYVFVTTQEEMKKQSIHGTDPRDNPEGGEAKHHGGA